MGKLKDKRILFLGSSITYGSSSNGKSFVECLEEIEGIVAFKNAISGTTLVEKDKDSYVSRLKKIDKNSLFDMVVVQLSTNDASLNIELGNYLDKDPKKTIGGAINYIIDYVKYIFDCPVIFYTSPFFESDNYETMVVLLEKISEHKKINIINMYRDKEFNNISEEDRKLFMADPVHPTSVGYLKWWTPYFIKELNKLI